MSILPTRALLLLHTSIYRDADFAEKLTTAIWDGKASLFVLGGVGKGESRPATSSAERRTFGEKAAFPRIRKTRRLGCGILLQSTSRGELQLDAQPLTRGTERFWLFFLAH
ncbi:hypothetical protein AVEN_136989-1 [Araneus ventricosus]|uniref:Uncharacterized protein n=1 Tax=Araneus ventricosus TaxID=182803 RepID=A0A4Y2P2N9_ARAVE|nr:hypothetical protein AVEN_136989-1 [Araneus ventricosus]